MGIVLGGMRGPDQNLTPNENSFYPQLPKTSSEELN